MMAKTDFQRGGAQDLVDYMSRDNEEQTKLKDHTGRELDPEQIEAFVERSEDYGIERHLILSPDPDAAYSETELDRATRQTMSALRSDERHATEYVYAIHADQANPHAHVAMTGPEQALHMDRGDVTELRKTARERFREPMLLSARAPEKGREIERQAASEAEREQRAERRTLDTHRDTAGPKRAEKRDEHSERTQGSDRTRGGR